MIHPEWQGETAFLLAGGPSLGSVPRIDIDRLKYYGRVIAINDSYQLVPDADVLYFCDASWWLSRKQGVANTFAGRYIITMDNKIPGVLTLKGTGASGLETDPASIRHGHNSGYAAINLAYHFGARQIVLLGYDMRVVGHRMHWHNLPSNIQHEEFQRILQQEMLPNFATLKAPLEQAGVQVLNATPDSALRVWPYVSLHHILNSARTINA